MVAAFETASVVTASSVMRTVTVTEPVAPAFWFGMSHVTLWPSVRYDVPPGLLAETSSVPAGRMSVTVTSATSAVLFTQLMVYVYVPPTESSWPSMFTFGRAKVPMVLGVKPVFANTALAAPWLTVGMLAPASVLSLRSSETAESAPLPSSVTVTFTW